MKLHMNNTLVIYHTYYATRLPVSMSRTPDLCVMNAALYTTELRWRDGWTLQVRSNVHLLHGSWTTVIPHKTWQGRGDSNSRVWFWRPAVWPLRLRPCIFKDQQKAPALGEGSGEQKMLRPSYASSPNDPLPGHDGSHGFGPYLHGNQRTLDRF